MPDTEEYIPFGEEWKKEMNKWSKPDLIHFLRETLIRKERLEKDVESLEERNKKLNYMIDNGLGHEDMLNDIKYPIT